jgi:hypothetical protein
MGAGGGGSEFLKLAFALLDACGFQAVDEHQYLTLEPEQLRAGLAEPPVVVGEFAQGGELSGRGGEVAGSVLSAVGQHGAGVECAPGAVAGGFSATAAEGIEGAGQERFALEEGFQQGRELLLELAELQAEGAEVVGHGWAGTGRVD